ncbi:hypothetical protein G6F56_007679 [Rhizopus delemar]|nr:hypothetical protein G6F56_007679 [Rhizopus delemar]
MTAPRGTLTCKYFTVDQLADTTPSLDIEDAPKTTNTALSDLSEKMNTVDETPETASLGSNNNTAMYYPSSADFFIFGEIYVNDLMNTNDQTPKDHKHIISMDEENDSTDTLVHQSSSSQQQITHSHSRNSIKAVVIKLIYSMYFASLSVCSLIVAQPRHNYYNLYTRLISK